jgi:hypothetical protein
MVEEQFHRDDEGRPLREARTPAPYLRADDIAYRRCPYPGSRQVPHNQMNMPALQQTSAHWEDITAALGVLRAAYAKARGSYGPGVMDFWTVSQLGSALPWYFLLRGEPLPAYAAALSKATLGTGILAQRMILKMMAEHWLPPPLTTPVVVALAESTGTLVGETEVCAAPEKMIARFIDVLVGAGDPDVTGSAPAASLLADRDRLLGFGAAYCAFKLALWVYFQARRFLYADICAATEAPAVRELLDAPCEPPDFFIIEPDNLAGVPLALRAAWIGQLAALIVPFAPDGSDRAVAALAHQMASAMQDDASDPVERAIAAFDKLDHTFGALVGCVESGLRGEHYTLPIDVATRDRLVATPPRELLAALR